MANGFTYIAGGERHRDYFVGRRGNGKITLGRSGGTFITLDTSEVHDIAARAPTMSAEEMRDAIEGVFRSRTDAQRKSN